MSEDFRVTNVKPRRITIAHQDIDPGQTSKPIQVLDSKGKVDPEKTKTLIDGVKASAPFRAGWLVEGSVSLEAPPQEAPPEILSEEDTKALIQIKLAPDLAILARWAAAENSGSKRRPILDAIGARAHTLNNKG